MNQNRKGWSQQEDYAIKSFVKKYGTKRWTVISQKMTDRFLQNGRSSKQCRERWYNHLSPKINKDPWSDEETRIIFKKHQQYGNKWSEISSFLHGRTDNSVKNQFYSTLRKGLRRMHRILGSKDSTNAIKKIKPNSLSAVLYQLSRQENSADIYQLIFSLSMSREHLEVRDKKLDKRQGQMESLLSKILNYPQNKGRISIGQKNCLDKVREKGKINEIKNEEKILSSLEPQIIVQQYLTKESHKDKLYSEPEQVLYQSQSLFDLKLGEPEFEKEEPELQILDLEMKKGVSINNRSLEELHESSVQMKDLSELCFEKQSQRLNLLEYSQNIPQHGYEKIFEFSGRKNELSFLGKSQVNPLLKSVDSSFILFKGADLSVNERQYDKNKR